MLRMLRLPSFPFFWCVFPFTYDTHCGTYEMVRVCVSEPSPMTDLPHMAGEPWARWIVLRNARHHPQENGVSSLPFSFSLGVCLFLCVCAENHIGKGKNVRHWQSYHVRFKQIHLWSACNFVPKLNKMKMRNWRDSFCFDSVAVPHFHNASIHTCSLVHRCGTKVNKKKSLTLLISSMTSSNAGSSRAMREPRPHHTAHTLWAHRATIISLLAIDVELIRQRATCSECVTVCHSIISMWHNLDILLFSFCAHSQSSPSIVPPQTRENRTHHRFTFTQTTESFPCDTKLVKHAKPSSPLWSFGRMFYLKHFLSFCSYRSCWYYLFHS